MPAVNHLPQRTRRAQAGKPWTGRQPELVRAQARNNEASSTGMLDLHGIRRARENVDLNPKCRSARQPCRRSGSVRMVKRRYTRVKHIGRTADSTMNYLHKRRRRDTRDHGAPDPHTLHNSRSWSMMAQGCTCKRRQAKWKSVARQLKQAWVLVSV